MLILQVIALQLVLSPQTEKWLLFKCFQEEIEVRFCINQDSPEMNCGGKCHLNSVMKEEPVQDETPIIPDFLSSLENEIEYIPEDRDSELICSGVVSLFLPYDSTSMFRDRFPDDSPHPPPDA